MQALKSLKAVKHETDVIKLDGGKAGSIDLNDAMFRS